MLQCSTLNFNFHFCLKTGPALQRNPFWFSFQVPVPHFDDIQNLPKFFWYRTITKKNFSKKGPKALSLNLHPRYDPTPKTLLLPTDLVGVAGGTSRDQLVDLTGKKL